ncbi:hypothetical protein LSH36_61g07011 [Paralvinella palmiformis]|uniref:Uncharacterized protein n=1 Tax=Paralvinella palmiformis TaxID=53620 RepID=A0AAD9K5N3_9ANNE|nr:hypothetical protein LSH36_61g07011 [Paralvinella palmiformis]
MAASIVLWFLVLWFVLYTSDCAVYNIIHQTPSDCKKGELDKTHEFFDISQLQCQPCTQNSTLQTVSADGLRCVCKNGMKIIQDFGGASIQCEPCPQGTVTSSNGWSCVACENGVDPISNQCNTCQDKNVDGTKQSRNIGVERILNGSWAESPPKRICETCDLETTPNSEGTQCFRCNQILSVLPSRTDCVCPEQNQAPGGVCFQSPDDIVEENQQLYKVEFQFHIKNCACTS